MPTDLFPKSQQENLLALLCFDDKHGRVVSNLVTSELFEGDYREFAAVSIQYWHDHKQAPKDHLPDLLAHVLDNKDNRKAPTYRRIFGQLVDLADGINAEFVLSRLHIHIRYQSWRATILEVAEQLQQRGEESLEDVEELINKQILDRQLTFDSGLRLSDSTRALAFFDLDRDVIKTGIPELDLRQICPRRKELYIMIAPRSRGKSMWLVHLGKMALMQRKRVVHVTLEMSEEQTAQRYIQSWFAIPKRRAKILYTEFMRDELDRLSGIEIKDELEPELSLDDKGAKKKLITKLEAWNRRFRNLVIKQFPTGTLTPSALAGYLDNLEVMDGFIPDLVIVDYAGIMKIDMNNPRVSRGNNTELLRGLAVQRNLAMVTAYQANRMGAASPTVLDTQIAEDFSAVATADNALTYSQTEAEMRCNLARLHVSKARYDEARFTVLLTQSYATSQFVLDSEIMRSAYWGYLEELSDDDSKDKDEDED